MTKKMALTALFSALGTMFLCLTGMIPTGTLALLCIASGFVALSVLECGLRWGLLSYLVISGLGFLLIPAKTMSLLAFVLLLGYYPVIKCLIERLARLWTEWVIKILFFAVAVCAILWLFSAVLLLPVGGGMPLSLLAPAGVLLLVVYDYALSLMLSYYRNRIK